MEEYNKRNLLNIYYLEVNHHKKAISFFLRFSLIFSVFLRLSLPIEQLSNQGRSPP